MRGVINEYVDHLMDRHQHSGTIGKALKKLHTQLERELGDFNPKEAKLSDPEWMLKLSTWGDLKFVEGVLETGAVAYMDCQACMKGVKR